VSFEMDGDEDIVRRLLGVCDRHRMQLASMLSFRHAERADGQTRRIGVARLVGSEDESVVDDIWATCGRVRRITRHDDRQGSQVAASGDLPLRRANATERGANRRPGR
jgi:hypothetical protein